MLSGKRGFDTRSNPLYHTEREVISQVFTVPHDHTELCRTRPAARRRATGQAQFFVACPSHRKEVCATPENQNYSIPTDKSLKKGEPK